MERQICRYEENAARYSLRCRSRQRWRSACAKNAGRANAAVDNASSQQDFVVMSAIASSGNHSSFHDDAATLDKQAQWL
jgi:hypothetical protein